MSVTTVAAAAPVRTSLGGTAVRGVAWLFAQNVATRFMVLAGQMLLARLLSPADFGVFGLAGTVVNVVSMVGDFGVQDVVLQRQRALRYWLTPAFWTSSLLGGAGLALVLLSAPLLSRLYAAPELPAMLALMGLAIPLTALANVPCILLRAQLRFRDLAMVGGAEVVGVQVLTVAFAAAKMGPYSFVLPLPIVALIRTAALWVTTRPKIGRPRLAHVRKILARGTHLLGTKVVTAAVSQGDYFVLGLFTSKAAVGAYYFAFRLAVQPLQLLATSVTNVVFPVLAQMGSDQARQRAAALAAARVLAYVAMPCCFLQAALAAPVVRMLAGHKWDAAVPIAQVLSVGLAFDAVAWIAGAVLRARGEFFSTFKYIGLCAVAFFGLVVTGAAGGTNKALAVALAVAIYYAAVTPLYSVFAFRKLGSPLAEVLGIYLPPAILAGVSVAAGAAAGAAVFTHPVNRAALTLLVSGVAYLAMLRLFANDALATIRQFLRSAVARRLAAAGGTA
ncbi:MAG: oligosaccharide flippase family protein [Polyangia bacterium]